MNAVIGVNLLWLVPGVVGGSEEYILRLLRAVDRLDPDDLWLRLYAQPELVEAHPDLLDRFEIRLSPVNLRRKSARILAEHSWLAQASRGDDLVHHGGGVIPAIAPAPAVVTIHDLQPLDLPENFKNDRRRWLDTMLPKTAKSARAILCPSEFTAGRVRELLSVEPERVVVVPHGHELVEPGVLDEVAHQQNLDRFGRYFLFPSITYAHKRHIDLVHALDMLRDRFPDLQVVMTGGVGPRTDAIANRITQLDLHDRCHVLGRVSENLLDSLYRSAAALVFPSAYEGFGNPTLEAMARGCPVVSTTAASIPEVVGDAALLVEPSNARDLAEAMARILTEPDLTASLRELGVERAKRFGWRGAGEALLSAYRDALP